MAIPDHQIRVIKELEEIERLETDLNAALAKLKDRSQKLAEFISTKDGLFSRLEPAEQSRLKSQHYSMVLVANSLHDLVNRHDHLNGYINTLIARIDAF